MTIGGRLLRLVATPVAEPVERARVRWPDRASAPIPGRVGGDESNADPVAPERDPAPAPGASATDINAADINAADINAAATTSLTREAISFVELRGAVRMVAEGQARRVTLGGFAWQSDQLPEIVAAARERGVRIIPTIAYGGGAVDIVVSRDERSGD